MKRVILAGLVAVLVGQYIVAPVTARQGPDDLKFFKNFFVTGDYYIAGVGLKDRGVGGFSTGSITVPADNPSTPAREGVPRGADMLGGVPLLAGRDENRPGRGGSRRQVQGIRPDAPRRPDHDRGRRIRSRLARSWRSRAWRIVPTPAAATATTGARVAPRPTGWTCCGSSTSRARAPQPRRTPLQERPRSSAAIGIVVPDVGGQGNQTPVALGASLVLVFRDPAQPSMRLSYDDGVTVGNAQRTLNQRISGFYQPAAVPNAKSPTSSGAPIRPRLSRSSSPAVR